jgi:hypothetical protein
MRHHTQQYVPISIVGEELTVNEVLQQTVIQTCLDSKGEVEHSLRRELVKVSPDEDPEKIAAGRIGEHIRVRFKEVDDAREKLEKVKREVDAKGAWDTCLFRQYLVQPPGVG